MPGRFTSKTIDSARARLVIPLRRATRDGIVSEWWNRQKKIESYLNAIAALLEDANTYDQYTGGPMPEQPSWSDLARILLAAAVQG